jgi:hypothetical protein
MKVNKKGQEMSVTTLVLIVIGVVLLVMLILGFSMGWQNLWGKINVLGGGSNVVTVIEACKIAATSDSTYSYCNEFKKVTIGSETRYYNCDANDVKSALDKKLTCNGNPVKDYCATLVKGKTGADLEAVKKINVNEGTCGQFADLFVPAADTTCVTGKLGQLVVLAPKATPPVTGCPTGKAPITDAKDVTAGINICCTK